MRRKAWMGLGLLLVSPTWAQAQVSFQQRRIQNPPIDLPVGPQGLAVADLTGDLRDDIIVVDNPDNLFAVYLNSGSGGFPGSPSATYGTAPGPVAVTTADFNNDGDLDVATANDDSGTITAYVGDGEGNLNMPRDFPVDSGPQGLVAVDLDNDTIPDLAVVSSESVHLLRSNGDGTFSNFSPASVATLCSGGAAIGAGLFDNNTNQDLAVTCTDSGQVSILLGNGDGTFQAAQLYNGGAGPTGLVIAPLRLPNQSDIAVVQADNFGDENVALLLGNGDGSFTFATTTAGVDSTAITAADFNSDGLIDLAATNLSESQSVAILLNTPDSGDDGFTYQPFVPGAGVGVSAYSIQRASIDANGLFNDLVVLAQDDEGEPLVGVLLNTSNQTPQPTTPSATPSATPTPPPISYVEFNITDTIGQPGDTVQFTVSLATYGPAAQVAATAQEIYYNSQVLTIDASSCVINPALANQLIASTVDFQGFPTVRVSILATPDIDPIAPGPLYTCSVQIAPSAFPTVYNVAILAGAFDPAGGSLNVFSGSGGQVVITFFPLPTPTATATPPPSDDEGCAIDATSSPSSHSWYWVGMLLALVRRWSRSSAPST